MTDLFIGIGLLLGIGLFGFAIVHSARRQRNAKAHVFADYAQSRGLTYSATDPGAAEAFVRDFDGLGRLHSPSLGKVSPEDVVRGRLNGREVILFRHATRFGEGWAREWFAAGVIRDRPVARRCAIQFCTKSSHAATDYLEDPVLAERTVGGYRLIVRAPAPEDAGQFTDDDVLERLGRAADALPFRPELQVRENRIVAYPADRNAALDDVSSLAKLVEFVERSCEIG